MNIRNIFKKRETDCTCIAVYNFSTDFSIKKEVYDFLASYFFDILNIEFKFLGVINRKYNSYYDKRDVILEKMNKMEWDGFVNLTLNCEDVRRKDNLISIDLSIGKFPETIITISKNINCNLVEFIRIYYSYFKITYGYSYEAYLNYWPIAYAWGDSQHVKKLPNITRLSDADLDKWFKRKELIKEGYIRDIYSENLLSSVHLSNMVNGQRLSELIQQEGWGKIIPVNNELFYWYLDKTQLNKARNYLYSTTIIL